MGGGIVPAKGGLSASLSVVWPRPVPRPRHMGFQMHIGIPAEAASYELNKSLKLAQQLI